MQNRKRVRKQSKNSSKANKKRKTVQSNPARSTGRGRYWNSGFTGSAPVAVSNDLQQYVTFNRGGSDSSLRVQCCIPLYQICSSSYAGSTLTIGGLSRDSSTNFASVKLGATGGVDNSSTTDVVQFYLSPVLQLQGTSFVRYAIKKLQFIYEPQSPTTISDRMIFAYANDPEHPMIQPNGDIPTQASLLALSDSVAFAPWRSWSLDVTKSVSQNLLYTSNDSNAESDNRFTYFGAIGCVPSVEPSSTTPVTVYGILYGCIEIEFREFCPLIEGFTPSTLSLIKKQRFRKLCSNPECKACSRECAKNSAQKVGESKKFELNSDKKSS